MKASFFSFALLAFAFWPFQGQVGEATPWVLEKHEAGIKVFTRKIEGSGNKEFRAETAIPGTLSEFVAVMQTVDRYQEWMPDTETSKLIARKSETNLFYYVETDAPWPVSNRDAAYSMTMQYRPNEKAVYCNIKCLANLVPVRDGIVRMTRADGYYKFREMGNGKVEVTLQIHAEPGGNIPAWLANASVTSTPMETLQNLAQEVKNARYKNQHFEFLAVNP